LTTGKNGVGQAVTTGKDGVDQTVTTGMNGDRQKINISKDGAGQRITVANDEVYQSKEAKNGVHECFKSSKGWCISRLEFLRTDYIRLTVIKDRVYHKASLTEDRADHIVTLDKNEEGYKRQMERINYTKFKNANDEIKQNITVCKKVEINKGVTFGMSGEEERVIIHKGGVEQ
jgi:hypothetical protein